MPHLNWISIAKNQDNKKEYAHESDKSTDKQLCKVKYIVGQSKNVIFITFQLRRKCTTLKCPNSGDKKEAEQMACQLVTVTRRLIISAKLEKRRLTLSSITGPKEKGLVITSFLSVLFSAKSSVYDFGTTSVRYCC